MTCVKATIRVLPNDVDVWVGYDSTLDATDEEKCLAMELERVLNEYLKTKKQKEVPG